MAFENAFGNVDFSMIPRSEWQQAQMLQQAVGQGLAIGQQAQERELRKRQLEQEQAAREAKAASDYKQLALDELNRLESGQAPTPAGQAAIGVMRRSTGDRVIFDPTTGQKTIQRSPWATALGAPSAGVPTTGGFVQEQAPLPPIEGGIVAAPTSAPGFLPEEQIPTGAQMPSFVTGEQFDATKAPTVGGFLSGTPAGEKLQEEARIDIQKDINKEYRKTALQKELGAPTAEKKFLSTYDKWKNTNDTIDDVISSVTPWTAGPGTLLSKLPATPARDLDAKLKRIQSDAAFGALQEMRDNSKTGGALGNVSEKELELLKSSVAALDPSQSPSQLQEQLANYKAQRVQSLRRVRDAYMQDYGYIPEELLKIEETPDPREIMQRSPEERLRRYQELIQKQRGQ